MNSSNWKCTPAVFPLKIMSFLRLKDPAVDIYKRSRYSRDTPSNSHIYLGKDVREVVDALLLFEFI